MEKSEAREIFAQNLRRIASEKGVTQSMIVAETKCSSATVSDWFNGKKYPRPNRMQRIADILGVRMSDLIRTDAIPVQPLPKGFAPVPPMATLPIVGAIACGTPITAEQNIEGYTSVPDAWRADFVLICKGDSMEPRIKSGDVVAIRQQETVDNGQIAAVLIGEEATLKKIYQYPDRLELRPLNPDYESIVLYAEEMNTATIEGRAVGICRDL